MDKLGVYFNNLTNHLVTSTGRYVPVVRRFGHSFLLWNTALQSFISESFTCNPCFLTEVELRRLHRRFGHPSIGKLRNVLELAGHDVDMKALLSTLRSTASNARNSDDHRDDSSST
jgi:hypothetical protein